MGTVLFVIPNLAGQLPKNWERRLSLSALDEPFKRFLRSASYKKTPHSSLLDIMYKSLKIPKDFAWARCALNASGIRINSNNWFKISLLTNQGSTILREHLIQKLAEEFVQDFPFAEDSIVTAQGDWYLFLKEKNAVVSTPVMEYIDTKTKDKFGLSGRDAKYWQDHFSEVNNWLKNSSINVLRLRQRLEPIVDFWPWGNGDIDHCVPDVKYSAVFSDSAIIRGAGSGADMSFFPLRNARVDFSQMVHNHPHICIFDDRLLFKVSDNDEMGWLDMRSQIANLMLAPAIEAVDKGVLDTIIIDTVNGDSFVYDKKIKFLLTRPKFNYDFIR